MKALWIFICFLPIWSLHAQEEVDSESSLDDGVTNLGGILADSYFKKYKKFADDIKEEKSLDGLPGFEYGASKTLWEKTGGGVVLNKTGFDKFAQLFIPKRDNQINPLFYIIMTLSIIALGAGLLMQFYQFSNGTGQMGMNTLASYLMKFLVGLYIIIFPSMLYGITASFSGTMLGLFNIVAQTETAQATREVNPQELDARSRKYQAVIEATQRISLLFAKEATAPTAVEVFNESFIDKWNAELGSVQRFEKLPYNPSLPLAAQSGGLIEKFSRTFELMAIVSGRRASTIKLGYDEGVTYGNSAEPLRIDAQERISSITSVVGWTENSRLEKIKEQTEKYLTRHFAYHVVGKASEPVQALKVWNQIKDSTATERIETLTEKINSYLSFLNNVMPVVFQGICMVGIIIFGLASEGAILCMIFLYPLWLFPKTGQAFERIVGSVFKLTLVPVVCVIQFIILEYIVANLLITPLLAIERAQEAVGEMGFLGSIMESLLGFLDFLTTPAQFLAINGFYIVSMTVGTILIIWKSPKVTQGFLSGVSPLATMAGSALTTVAAAGMTATGLGAMAGKASLAGVKGGYGKIKGASSAKIAGSKQNAAQNGGDSTGGNTQPGGNNDAVENPNANGIADHSRAMETADSPLSSLPNKPEVPALNSSETPTPTSQSGGSFQQGTASSLFGKSKQAANWTLSKGTQAWKSSARQKVTGFAGQAAQVGMSEMGAALRSQGNLGGFIENRNHMHPPRRMYQQEDPIDDILEN